MTSGVQIDGLARLRRALAQLDDDLAGELKDANGRAGAVVVPAAAGRAPRRSGRLAASGRANRAGGRASVSFGSAAVPYAGPIHWGWPARGIAAQPFAVEGAEATRPVWEAAYVADVEALLDKVAGTY